MIEVITYKEIIEKYPEAATDIKRLQDSKNAALTYYKICYYALGMFIGLLLGYFLYHG